MHERDNNSNENMSVEDLLETLFGIRNPSKPTEKWEGGGRLTKVSIELEVLHDDAPELTDKIGRLMLGAAKAVAKMGTGDLVPRLARISSAYIEPTAMFNMRCEMTADTAFTREQMLAEMAKRKAEHKAQSGSETGTFTSTVRGPASSPEPDATPKGEGDAPQDEGDKPAA